jgi:hypothetical protein
MNKIHRVLRILTFINKKDSKINSVRVNFKMAKDFYKININVSRLFIKSEAKNL